LARATSWCSRLSDYFYRGLVSHFYLTLGRCCESTSGMIFVRRYEDPQRLYA